MLYEILKVMRIGAGKADDMFTVLFARVIRNVQEIYLQDSENYDLQDSENYDLYTY